MNRPGAQDGQGQELSGVHSVMEGSPLTKRTGRYFYEGSPHCEEILLSCRIRPALQLNRMVPAQSETRASILPVPE